ncbi:MAG: DnaJ domain-containing protein [Candidatus Limnocylindria bacterium]
MSTDFDAYRTLQVVPDADDFVIEAAFRVLARRYHPDGHKGDAARMAEINRAYDLLRTPIRRRRYDRERQLTPVGPGRASVQPPPTNGYAHAATNGNRHVSFDVVDFGRYEGWTLKDLAKHDPDYLRWLSRSSGGVRYRNQIHVLLPDELEAAAAKMGPPGHRD